MRRIILISAIVAIFQLANGDVDVKCSRSSPSYYSSSLHSSLRTSYSYGILISCIFSNVTNAAEFANVLANKTQSQKSVSSITIVSSNLPEFPANTFDKFDSLKQLTAIGVGMKTLTSSFLHEHTAFEMVDLSRNKIIAIEAATFENISISSVDLSYNQIATIDSKAFSRARIQKLNLRGNQIKQISFVNTIAYFSLLDLSENQFVEINSIDVDVAGWASDTILVLLAGPSSILLNNNTELKTFNCKSTIPFSLIALKDNAKLSSVALNNCTVGSLQVSGGGDNLKNVQLNDKLETFAAENKPLTQVDFSIAKKLTSLLLANASLSPQAIDTVMQIEGLRELDLSGNLIGAVNISTFAKLKNLKTLKLRSTMLTNIQFGTFSHQEKVESLDLANNQLLEFDMNMIYSMTSLLQLDISGNELQELHNYKYAHQQFTMMRLIDLTHNNFTCKYLMTLIKVLRNYQVVLSKNNMEERGYNIQGVRCLHVEDDGLEPLEPRDDNSTGYTDVFNKINEIMKVIGTMSEKIKKIENDHQTPVADALHGSSSLEVRNSSLMESALIVVCMCFTVFMGLKIFLFVKRNFIDGHSSMRRSQGMSECALNIADDF